MSVEQFGHDANRREDIASLISDAINTSNKRNRAPITKRIADYYKGKYPLSEMGFANVLELISTHFRYQEATDIKDKGVLKEVYLELIGSKLPVPLETRSLMGDVGLLEGFSASPALPVVPIEVKFKLTKPLTTRDDGWLHLTDNPVRKEKVFKAPMISGSSWKGVLRAAGRLAGVGKPRLVRLFGSAKGEETEALEAGRVRLGPTYFWAIGAEVLNPHSRETRAGTNPIYLETVPVREEGILRLLYFPFDLVGRSNDRRVAADCLEDLEVLCRCVVEALTVYGPGGKTTSGFGLCEATEILKPLVTVVAAGIVKADDDSVAVELPPAAADFVVNGEFPPYNNDELREKQRTGAWSKTKVKRYKALRAVLVEGYANRPNADVEVPHVELSEPGELVEELQNRTSAHLQKWINEASQ